MTEDDLERLVNREAVLYLLLAKEFSENHIHKTNRENAPSLFRIEVPAPKEISPFEKLSITVDPEIHLMTEIGNNHRRVIEEAVKKAKEILADPPDKKQISQGTIFLEDYAARFARE